MKRDSVSKFVVAVVVFAIMAMQADPCSASRQRKSQARDVAVKEVLILNAYHQGLTSTEMTCRGIVAGLGSDGVMFHYEYLDSKHRPGTAWHEQMAEVFREKYLHREFSVIMAVDDDALDFLLAHRDEIFGAVPVVHCGVNRDLDEHALRERGFVGMREVVEVGATLRTAIQLFPKTRRIVVITDDTTTGKLLFEPVDTTLLTMSEDVDVDWWLSPTKADMARQLPALDSDTLVIMGPMSRDREGVVLDYRDTLAHMARHSPVPIFTFWRLMVDSGSLGGFVVDMEDQGWQAGQIARDILSGHDLASLPISRGTQPRYVFNYDQMERFGIRTGDLPPSSVTINRPATLLEKYQTYLIVGIAVSLIQAVIIVCLLVLYQLHRRKYRHALQDSEQRYRTIVEDHHEAICRLVMNEELTLVYVNVAFARLFQSVDADATGLTVSNVCGSRMAQQLHLAIVRWPDDKEVLTVQLCLTLKHGRHRWLRWTLRRLGDQEGKPAYQAFVWDITKSREAEWHWKRLALAAESTADAVVITDPRGRIEFVNAAFSRITGYRMDEVIGGNPNILKSNLTPDHLYHEMWENLQSGKPWSGRLINRRKHNTRAGHPEIFEGAEFESPECIHDLYWAHLTISPVLDSKSQVIGFVAVQRDITPEVAAERELQHATKLQRNIIDTAATAIFTIDRQGLITSVNSSLLTMTGYREDELVGKACSVLRGECSGDMHMCSLLGEGGGAKIYRKQCKMQAKDGRVLTIIKNASVTRDAFGQVTGGIESFVDVTELVDARESAEEATRVKSDFLANMSHEIRTPMTAILGFTDDIIEGDHKEYVLPDSVRNAVRIVQSSGHHLLTLINELLDLSKIEAGKMTVERIPCRAHQVVAEVASTMRVRALEKGLRLEVTYGPDMPERVLTDPTRLRQILVNLVGNALKFTTAGCVRIDVRLEVEDVDHPNPRLCFAVEDTGSGISDDVKAKLFQPFVQADASMTRRFGGTGLGLAISRTLAEMLGGDITLESEVGKGSRFTLAIDPGPLTHVAKIGKLNEAMSLGDSPTDVLPDKLVGRVLLAEDNPTNQQLIRRQLIKAGLEVDVVNNGKLAIETVLASSEQNHPYDLILMDVQMPEMDGCESTQRLRDKGETLPIIALTANAMQSDRERCLAAGCDDFASKPINREVLLQKIHHYLARAA